MHYRNEGKRAGRNWRGLPDGSVRTTPACYNLSLIHIFVIRLAVYVKGKNAKKYRKGMEYGSARWGNAEDIKPYICLLYTSRCV